MMRLLTRLSLFSRMALILLAGLLAALSVSFWLQWGERATAVSQVRGQNVIERLLEVVRVLEAEAPERRARTLAALQSRDWRVELIAEDQVLPHAPRGQLRHLIAGQLGGEREIRSAGGGGGMPHVGGGGGGRGSALRTLDVRLRDGQWVRVSSVQESEPPALPPSLIAQLILMACIVVAVALIAVRQATRPLKLLAEAADQFGRSLDAPALAEAGPAETRQAAQAFNRMQGRIKRLIDERARALAAVSHDLRTPLTRLRLRAELVADERLREQIAADLDAMTAMIDATLDYLRGLQESEPVRPIDMNALLQSMAEDAAVQGREVSVSGRALAPYSGRLSALRRALQNLVDNAVKYGHRAAIRIDDDGLLLQLIVEDEGPGIAPEELERVTEPYYRPDASRSRETGGVGLGLSIVRDIAQLHGGQLTLANRPQGGLAASLRLPRGESVAA